MKRNEWEFEYTAHRLAEAAMAKKEAHQAKFKWWEAKKAEVMATIRETGIEIRDSVAATYSNTQGNYGPQIEIAEGMQRDLREVQMKLLEHDRLIQEYEGWRQVLGANPEARLRLNHEDWLYFFGV